MLIAGSGTAVNVLTVLVGSSVGVLAGNRLPTRTRDLVTDALTRPGTPAATYDGLMRHNVTRIVSALSG